MADEKNYTLSALKQLIDSHEAISFDIFDTLVMRKVYFNHDVFRIVGEKYKAEAPGYFNARFNAERELSKTRYPYIEEIYDHLAERLGISAELKAEIMNYEIEVERQVIVVREDVVDVFNYCKQTGKRVYIVSDMYMHQSDLESIINNIGIVGYDQIFVSSEYDTSKPQRLFECYLKEIQAGSYLHVGDSLACDIIPSTKLGMDNFRLKTSAEIWEGTGDKPSEDLNERRRQSELIAERYNSPFSK
ncbi:MAG: hypothetical protein IJV67_07745 [Clostridia bacterium]|nr:hypothetical protein [Clostridia bacterium]